MALTEIDHWIGKNLFVPPIVKLCQLTRQSQFAVARLFWFVAALDAFYRAVSWLDRIIWGGMSLIMMVSAARRADHPTRSLLFFRMVAVVLLCADLAEAVASGKWAFSEFWLLVLFAEYAATIRTLPPSSKAERQAPKSASRLPGN